MKKQHIILRSSLVAFALFFSAFTIAFGNIYIKFNGTDNSQVLGANTSSDEKDLIISSDISNIIEQDGFVQATYKFSAKNNKSKPINNLKLKADFNGTFPLNEFNITNIQSEYAFNEEFDGVNKTDLFNDFPVLEPGNVATVNVTVLFDPKGFEGPFENTIFATGLYDGEEIVKESQSNNGEQNQNNVSNNNQPANTNTSPNSNSSNNNTNKPKETPKETNFSERDIKIYLVDTTTRKEFIEITGGEEITFEKGDNPFTLKVDVNPGTIGSVVFGLNGNNRYRVENALPYAIINNSLNHYDAWYPAAGTYNLSITVFSQDGGKGEILGTKQVTFILSGDVPKPVVVELQQESEKETVLTLTESSAKSSFSITLTPVEVTQPEETVDPEIEPLDTTPQEAESDADIVIESTPTTSNSGSSNNSNITGVTIFDDTIKTANLGQVSGVSTQSNEVSLSNPFEENSGSVNGLSASTASVSTGKVLAATGINISQTILIGLIIMIGVIELNAFRTEKKFIENLADHKSLL
ncbi:hypothetical protein KC669_03600 [Candidatus Dojkabacteria bacterium]|uniref:Uncharacterized protein n=1 Tax=Candidatus Dojkabacteria bacterium TaxID=2099670 RepID=A0A955LAF5_9BACT|nr:hypothetical protein [Candidatus Dojkabacteria bacterium]